MSILFDRLTLRDNQLTSLPASIGSLTNLTTYGIRCIISLQFSSLFDRLILSRNRLTSVPDSIGQLTNLTE